MFNKLKEARIVDIQSNMIAILALIMCFALVVMFLLPTAFHRYLSIASGLFIANWSLLPFFIEIKLDKGWILSVIGVENYCIVAETKKGLLKNPKFLLYVIIGIYMIMLSNTGLTPTHALFFAAIVLWIYFTLRMITQLLGYYIYWVARMNNDPQIRENVPDILILQQSFKAAKTNYRCAWLFIVLSFIFLGAYFFLEYYSPASPEARLIFTSCAVLLFFWIVLFLILGQLFDKNVVMLYIIRSGLFNDLCAVIGNSMQNRVFLMKHLLALFLFMEVIVFPIIFKIIL